MPCYSKITVSHNVGKWNKERAEQAIRECGMQYSATYQDGGLFLKLSRNQDQEPLLNQIKRKYAELTLKESAKRFGWTIKNQTTTQQGLTQVHLFRR